MNMPTPVGLTREGFTDAKSIRQPDRSIRSKASELAANPLNWRKHPQRQREAVQASLRELGWVAAVVENVRTGYLIDGHERVWQAMQNDEDVPVLQVDLSEDEEKLALATFDPIGALAEADADALDALLREVNTGEAALQELLAELAEDAGVLDVIGFDGEGDEKSRETNNLSIVGKGENVGLQCGDIMVVIPRVLYDRVWEVVNSPDYPDRRAGVMAILEEGLARISSG